MIVIFYLICAVGLPLAIMGMRGSIIGDDPHCRRCGLNLRGRNPSSSRCPECGTELDESAIRYGLRRRRPALLSSGLVLLAIGIASVGVTWWATARDYDWTPWKPTAWLVDDLDSSDPQSQSDAKRELLRRIGDPSFNQAKLNLLMDRALDRQADRSKKWDLTFAELIEAAALAQRVDDERLQRYLTQGTTAIFRIKPKLRRKQNLTFGVDLELDRYGTGTRLRGNWTTSPLTIGGVEMVKAGWASDAGRDELHGMSYTNSLTGGMWNVRKLPDGKHEVRGSVILTVAMTQPLTILPLTLQLPLSAPVELFSSSSIVDEFKVDESLREPMHEAVSKARVTRNQKGDLDVRLKVGELPMPLAAEIVLMQGSAKQSLGTILIHAGQKPRWVAVETTRRPIFSGIVDLHVRPSQIAADSEQNLATYWGEPIVIRQVQVDAPYDPPFVHDESLRPAVEKSLRTPKITRTGKTREAVTIYFGPTPAWAVEELEGQLDAFSPPVKLAFNVFLSHQGREVKVVDWVVPANQSHGYGWYSEDIDPARQATECDVIFRPDPNWEIHSDDLTPPWYGDVVFRNVRIETPTPPATNP